MMDKYYHILYIVVLLGLGVGLLLALIRSMIGPRVADRIIGVNLIGTLGALCIVLLSLLLDEAFIIDVALIYCLVSFLAVIVLARIYISTEPAKRRLEEAEKQEESHE